MKRPKVAYYEINGFQPTNVELLERSFDLVRLNSPNEDTPEILASVDGIVAPLQYLYSKEKLDTFPRLKVICTNCTGAPHVDIGYAESRGIRVMYLRHEKEFLRKITPTAELTWGLLLCVTRRIPGAFSAVCSGKWNRHDWPAPQMLSRMSLGIVGLGRLGTMVARYGKTFDMTVRYYTTSSLEPMLDGIHAVQSLEELVSLSDVVSLHSHLPEDGKCMIDAEVLGKFKHGSYLINTARGPLVDGDALVEALQSGRLAGAGIDVHPREFEKGFLDSIEEDCLIQYAREHDNLILTPHIGGCTVDAWEMTEAHVIQMMIKAFNESC